MAKEITITYLNPVECRVDAETAKLIRPILSFTAVYYQNTPFKKIRKEYLKSTMTKDERGYYFLSGMKDRVSTHLEKLGCSVTFSMQRKPIPYHNPTVQNIVLREDQIPLIENACKAQRGIIQAVTGSGKTIIGIALYSCFDNIRVLWLTHTKDLMAQTAKEFKKLGFKSVGLIGDGSLTLDKQITIATRQSFKKLLNKIDPKTYDMIIVDENHHLSQLDGEFAMILKHLQAPLRFGLTATPIETEEGKFTSEGLLGPIVASLSVQEGNELGIVAKPIIKLLRVPKNHSVNELRRYQDVYQEGVVESKVRNTMIIEKAKEHVLKGDSVLILVSKIEHGNILQEIGKENNLPIVFVQGSTENDLRMKVKEALDEKKIHCVIATAVWYEGISIRSLNCIINAAGGKSEIRTLQTIGRGLRVTDEKKSVIIWDLFDTSHHFLISHFGDRMCTYSDQGWLG